MSKTWINRWVPALSLMAVIFLLSSRPSAELPDFGSWDYVLKKGGHVLGYGALALCCWRGFELRSTSAGRAWLLAVCYAITDEIHQSFVPGRHASVTDVLIFDNLGAALALYLWARLGDRLRERTTTNF